MAKPSTQSGYGREKALFQSPKSLAGHIGGSVLGGRLFRDLCLLSAAESIGGLELFFCYKPEEQLIHEVKRPAPDAQEPAMPARTGLKRLVSAPRAAAK